MKPIKFFSLSLIISLCISFLSISTAYSQGLENVIVERYYVDAPNAADTTYRVYVDMAPGYKLLAVFGFDNEDPGTGNALSFSTSTGFYNDNFGVSFGNNLNSLLFTPFPNSPLDTYLSFGAAATNQFGIPKADDTDGSDLVNGLINTPPDGISPSDIDGFQAGSTTGSSTLAMNTTGAANDGDNFIGSEDGSYFVLGGVQGIGPNNTILIGQFTTGGDFEFEINIQIQSADGENEIYVHTNSEQPDGSFGIVSPFLKFPIEGILGCTNSEACNFNEAATLDDGSCIVPEPDCTTCNSDNTGLDLIDDDGDGICNADEIPGCTNPLSCNFDNNATDDDGSCTDEPEPDCSFCVGSDLVLIDDDGDGVCNADEIPGCTNPLACNYNEEATDEDGSCTDEPEENCTECDGQELILIDSDGDGICDAQEIPGCTSPTACNYDDTATDDNGSCIEPVENCFECNESNDGLDIIDNDGDGVCNAQDECPELPNLVNGDPCITNEGFDGTIAGCECITDIIEGCISQTACNFNPDANLDDGSCIEPEENCFECNENNDGLIIIDSDGDGICDANEVPGCTNPLSCNYNENATDDDGSCTDEPEENCTVCDGQELIFIDTDGDGICDANEIPGCTNPLSCNYNENATDDDGSCTDEPEENCTVCDGQELILIDTDGDGICDANEIPGCTNPLSCNYNGNATDDDGSCTDEPEENCTECDGDELVLIDTDGDGICDANEIPGCTDPEAENYNPDATDEDGSCLYIASITLLELDCGAMVIQITNAQETSTDGGDATAETRTAYIYLPDDQNGEPTYTGSSWPYLLAPVGFSIDDAEITAEISTNSEGILLVEGRPLYQYTGDNGPEDTNGTFGPWYYLLPNGGISQDACNEEGITENNLSADITLFPNPTRKELNIQIGSQDLKGEKIRFLIFNALGEKVLEEQSFMTDEWQTFSFNTELLSQGVYLLNIEADNRKKSLRFIKN